MLPGRRDDAFRRGRAFALGLQRVLARMEERDVVLQLHGESTGGEVDPYDRESDFIERELAPLRRRHPRLRIVLEHVTTAAGVDFVRAQD